MPRPFIASIFIATLALWGAGCSKPEADPAVESLRKDVAFLAQDSLQGRAVGSAGERRAASYIVDRFREAGLIPYGSSGYYQPFPYKPLHAAKPPNQKKADAEAHNIVGLIDNAGSDIIVIGAHYDHLGYGGAMSLRQGAAAIHNGADDNASGVALMIWLAHELKQKTMQSDVAFVAFSGEEEGLQGSGFFCKTPTIALSKVSAMINLDMVGRLDAQKGLIVAGVGTSPAWKKALGKANVDTLRLVLRPSGIGPSDHTSFYLQKIPILHFFTGAHKDYHTPDDDADKINYEGMRQIGRLIEGLVLSLDSLGGKLPFTPTADEHVERPNFSVTLGVMPGYGFEGKGMRIDAVNQDGAAQKAGLRAGDIVVRMGSRPIDDLDGYMQALAFFHKGDRVAVEAQRGGKLLTTNVVF